MARRSPTLAARITQPLAFADDHVNAMSDWLNDKAPWAWWPARPPSRHAAIGPDVHAAYLAQLVGVSIPIELAMRRTGHLPEGRRLWFDRGLSVALTVVAAAITSGAWDRRAARRRLPLGR